MLRTFFDMFFLFLLFNSLLPIFLIGNRFTLQKITQLPIFKRTGKYFVISKYIVDGNEEEE